MLTSSKIETKFEFLSSRPCELRSHIYSLLGGYLVFVETNEQQNSNFVYNVNNDIASFRAKELLKNTCIYSFFY